MTSGNGTSFTSHDGLRLEERTWRPPDQRAVLVIVHGFGEHCGRYRHVADHLNREGFAVEAFDLRGHGKSEGKRALVRSFDDLLNDLARFLSRVRDRNPSHPIFLMGHSMGGTIVTLFALTHRPDIRGLILSGPSLALGAEFTPIIILAAKLLARVAPTVGVKTIPPEALSRDEQVVHAYENDPLVHHGAAPAGTGAAIIRAMSRIEEQEESLKVPLLIMHGSEDQLTEVEGSRRLYRRAASEDKTLQLYDGYYHEVLNAPEPQRQAPLADLLTWLEAHLDDEQAAG